MAIVDEMTDAEIDKLFERLDLTEPKLQRRIIAEFVLKASDSDDLKALARELAAALVTFVEVSKHALKRWDSDEDSKVGKLLSAMSGHLTGYRYDITAIHDAIAKAKAAIGDVQPIPNEYTPAAATA